MEGKPVLAVTMETLIKLIKEPIDELRFAAYDLATALAEQKHGK